MKQFIKKSTGIFFITCLLISNLYVPKVKAQTLGDLKKELEQFKQEYEENQNEQELTEKEMQQIKSNISSIEANIDKIGDDIIQLNAEIVKLNEDIDKSEEEIEAILSFTQISNGESVYLEYAFGAQDFTDFIYRIAVSEQLTTYNDDLVEQYKDNISENKKKTEELELKKEKLNKEQEDLRKELEKLNNQIKELDDLALDIDDQIKARESQIKIYEDKGCKDNEDIKTCGRALLPADTKMWRPIKNGYVSGVLGLFGTRDCSNSAVSCFHHGLDMSYYGANTGSIPVYSVANGIVIAVKKLKVNPSTGRYVSNQCGGRQVFIQHNINEKIIMSGYLHLRRVDVEEGQVVTKDTQIGIIGGYPHSNYEYYDNCSTGAHLHLEISTGDFNAGTYYAYRQNPMIWINFPSRNNLGTIWNEKNTYLK